MGDYPQARADLTAALSISQELGDRHGEAATLHQLASIDLKQGDYEPAREQFARALELRQELGDRHGEAEARHALASINLEQENSPSRP